METISAVINGNKFSVSADEALVKYSRFLFGTLERIPQSAIKDGYRTEIGFSVFICQKVDDGYKIVVPHYVDSPFNHTTDDLTLALWILVEQTKMLRICKLDGVATRFDDEIVVAKGALDSQIISLQRYPDLGKGASGWCIEAVKENEDGTFHSVQASGYESIYAYQLLQMRPALMKILALPYNYLVVFDGDNISEIINENDESILE